MKITDGQRPCLINNLLVPESYDHPVGMLSLIETHISYIILTGEYAYKLKKAVDLGFVDFSTLAKRRHYCYEEIRLNRRLAPELYVGVVAVRGTEENPHLGGDGPIIEYAVKMRQFDPDLQLDKFVLTHTLATSTVEDFAMDLAAFHDSAARAPVKSGYASSQVQRKYVMENFEQTRDCTKRWHCSGTHSRLEMWCDTALKHLEPRFAGRLAGGFVRECHGDLHLGNLAFIEGRITAFDCLEFNPMLRWIDVISEVAFLDMDLRLHGLNGLANRFLNKYLEQVGDYAGLALLSLFRVYRAMVRAKVACLRTAQDGTPSLVQDFASHIALAQQFSEQGGRRVLIITHGLSGSGKTTLTDRLLDQFEAIRIRSDIERKRLRHEVHSDRYSPAAIERTYAHMIEQAQPVLVAGHSVILDATFLRRAQREQAAHLAEKLSVPFVLLDIRAPEEVLRSRIDARLRSGRDASEATIDVLALQQRNRDALTATEQDSAIILDSATPIDFGELAENIRHRSG